jgi:hypothetical protein
MQQRRLRLGDILDDYCPRERRLTNHAVVAKIDDEVKLTRCLTCDTEHEYRGGKAPTLRKKKDNVAAAYREVLAEVTKGGTPGAVVSEEPEPVEVAAASSDVPSAQPAEVLPAEETRAQAPVPPAPAATEREPAERPLAAAVREEAEEQVDAAAEGVPEAGRVHRRLIRATLPRPENQPVARPIPQFTMRQPTGRAGKFRPSTGRGPRPAAGARAGTVTVGRSFPSRGGAAHQGRPGRGDAPRARGAQPPRQGKKHSK